METNPRKNVRDYFYNRNRIAQTGAREINPAKKISREELARRIELQKKQELKRIEKDWEL